MFDGFFDGGEAGEVRVAESGVHEESGALRLQQGDIAGAAGRQNGKREGRSISSEREETDFRIIAERVGAGQ